jgi:hypothetical protein
MWTIDALSEANFVIARSEAARFMQKASPGRGRGNPASLPSHGRSQSGLLRFARNDVLIIGRGPYFSFNRHDRACPGHPRRRITHSIDVDARHPRVLGGGHDGTDGKRVALQLS